MGWNIERMFSDSTVFWLFYGSVCIAATEGTFSTV